MFLGRLAIALMWLYQGLWCKVLGRNPRHAEIVGSTPLLAERAHLLVVVLGWVEVLLGVWVLTGIHLTIAAVVQTVLLLGMNTGGLVWARPMIPDPAGMLVQNFVFLALIWTCR